MSALSPSLKYAKNAISRILGGVGAVPNQARVVTSIVFCLVILGTAPCEAIARASSNPPPVLASRRHAPGDPWGTLWMGAGTDVFRDVAVMVGAVFAAGHSRDPFPGPPDRSIVLVRYTPEGEQVWSRTWSANYDEAAYGLVVSYPWVYLAGSTASRDSQGDALLMKLDLAGNAAWNTTWGGAGADWFSRVAVGTDGVYVVGSTRSYGAGESDALLVKFDFDGHQVWNTTWGGPKADYGYGLALASDGIYISGQKGVATDSNSNATLVRFSPTGLQVWNASWRAGSQNAGMALALVNDSLYVTGWTRTTGANSTVKLPLLKFSNTGSLLWNRTYSAAPLSNDLGYAVAVASNLVYVAGDSRKSLAVPFRSVLLCFNNSGTLQWNRTWGGAKDCNSHALTAAVDGLYLAGATNGWLVGEGDGVLVKWSFNGTSTPGPIQLGAPGEVDYDGTFPLSWSNTSDPNGAIPEYRLQMSTSPDFQGFNTTWTTTSTSFLIEGLGEGSYHFRVRAQDDAGLNGPWSNTETVTVTIPPALPLNPWLAPVILVIAVGVMATAVIVFTIRRRRFGAPESSDVVLLLPLSF